MNGQKFHRGDIVRVISKFPKVRRYFRGAGEEAMIWDSYSDMYGGIGEEHQYELCFKEHGRASWYPEHELTLVKAGPGDITAAWRKLDGYLTMVRDKEA